MLSKWCPTCSHIYFRTRARKLIHIGSCTIKPSRSLKKLPQASQILNKVAWPTPCTTLVVNTRVHESKCQAHLLNIYSPDHASSIARLAWRAARHIFCASDAALAAEASCDTFLAAFLARLARLAARVELEQSLTSPAFN